MSEFTSKIPSLKLYLCFLRSQFTFADECPSAIAKRFEYMFKTLFLSSDSVAFTSLKLISLYLPSFMCKTQSSTIKLPISKVGVLSSLSFASPDGFTSNFSLVISCELWLLADAINFSTSTLSIVKFVCFTTIGNFIWFKRLPVKSNLDRL